jgi:hypothetical protein
MPLVHESQAGARFARSARSGRVERRRLGGLSVKAINRTSTVATRGARGGMFGAAPGGHFYGESPRAGLALEVRPEFHNPLLGVHRAFVNGAIIIRSDHHGRSPGGAQLEEFRASGFPVPDRPKRGRSVHRLRMLERCAPALTLFFFDREDIAMLRQVCGRRLAGEDLVIEQPQG